MRIIVLLIISFSVLGCYNSTKKSVDISKYDGVKLINRDTDWTRGTPPGAYIHTFRKNDSVWSESFMYGVFAEYKEGDVIRSKSKKP